ncbi:MAG: hypothetical protein HPY50_08860 [Firmicutes bacterium]|nr:hypothetical protein [Bacillota bacterium]
MHQEQMENPVEEARMKALKEELKTELINVRASERRMEPTPPLIDPRTRENLKREIMEEMRRSEEPEYGYGRGWKEQPGYDQREIERLKQDLKHEISRDMRWGTMPGRIDAYDRRMLDAMRDEVRAEMRAQQVYQDHWSRNPQSFYTRELSRDMMEEAQEMGYTPNEMLRAIQQLQRRGTLRYRFNQLMNSREGRGFKWGVGATVLAMLFLPSVAKSMRPITKWAVKETMEISEKVQGIVSNLKEDVEDILAEAQFERAKNTIDDEIGFGGEAGPVAPSGR